MNWIDKAVDQAEQEYEDGLINLQEFQGQLADIKGEAQQEAENAAQAAYNDCMGW